MIHAIYLLIIALLIMDKIFLYRKIRRLKHEAIHWQQAYNNNDSWSAIAFQHQRELRRITEGKEGHE